MELTAVLESRNKGREGMQLQYEILFFFQHKLSISLCLILKLW